MSNGRQLVTAAVVLSMSSAAQADTIYVDDDNCPGPGSGTPADPYCSIQAAIEKAEDTDEIVVAPGTYFETTNFLGKAITLRSTDGPEVTAIDAGGLLYVGSVVTCEGGEGPDTVLQGFTVTGGHAFEGGGMYSYDSSPTVIGCVFLNNIADTGGGIYNEFSSATFVDCIFDGNAGFSFVGGLGGGGMYSYDSSPTVIGCTFRMNTAVFQLVAGGGMYNDASNAIVINCLFDANAGFGGGMFNVDSSPIVTNCTFTGNGGDGIRNFSSNAILTNCVLWANLSEQIFDTASSSSTVSYSDVQGGWFGAGSNNIDADPLFATTSDCCTFDFESGCDDPDCEAAVCESMPFCCDLEWDVSCAALAFDMCSVCPNDNRLQSGSPCIDAGDNTAVPKLVLRDLDGAPRFVADACAGATGATVDMGVYEFQGTSCNLSSMLALLAAWGCCDDCSRCLYDFDGDCTVGILDLLILLANWR